jgi:hypothetical protein
MKTTSNTNKEICVWPSFASGLRLPGAPCRSAEFWCVCCGLFVHRRGQQKMK